MAVTLLGEWGFLDNLNDTSGNGRNGTFVDNGVGGSLTYVDGPQPGTRGVKFGHENHTIDYGRTGLEPALDGITVMGWMRIENAAATNHILGLVQHARVSLSSRLRLGALKDPPGSAGGERWPSYAARWKNDLQFGDIDVNTAWQDQNWHHVALVDGNTTWAVLVDGVVKTSASRAFDNSTSPTWEAYPWRSGYDPTLTDVYADPALTISGVRIFQGEATTAEIQAWMNRPIMATSRHFFSLMQ